MFLDVQSTLHALTEEGTCLFLKCGIHHGQYVVRVLIFSSLRHFNPEFISVFLRFATHVDQVGELGDIIATMLYAMIFFVVHDVKPIFVFILKTS